MYSRFCFCYTPLLYRSVPELLELALKVGEVNYKAMQELDAGHDTQFGTPEPTQVMQQLYCTVHFCHSTGRLCKRL